MSAVPPQPEEDERRRRSFRLLTFLVAVISSGIAVVVTVTQWAPLTELVAQTEGWWWKFLGLPSVLLPIVLGIVVATGALTRGWSSRSRRQDAERVVTEPIDPGGPLERAGWRVSEVYLLLYPLTVATLPIALTTSDRVVASESSFHVVAMYSMVATLLSSMALTGVRRWVYVGLVQIVTTTSFLAASDDPQSAVLFVLYSFVLSLTTYTASLTLQRLAYSVDAARRQDEYRVAEEAALAARLAEAARIDGLVHDHILSSLLLTARASDLDDADSAEHAAQVRKHAGVALDTLDQIARPDDSVSIEPLTPSALHALLETQVRALAPDALVSAVGTRSTSVPGEVGHTIVAAACEAVRNSLRHSGPTASDGSPVTRRVTLHSSDMGVTTTVLDDGAGFDPARVPARRLGLRGSILRRMDNLPGGGAEVDSAIGEGTRVSLSWVDPRLRVAGTRAAGDPQRERPDEELLDTSAHGVLPLDVLMVSHVWPIAYVATGLAIASFVGMATVTMPLFHPDWVAWTSIGLLVLASFVAGGLLFRRAGSAMVWMPWMLTCLPPALTALGMWGYRGTGFSAVEVWQIVASILIIVLHSIAGYVAPSVVGGLAVSAVVLLWPSIHVGIGTRIPTVITLAVFIVAGRQLHRWVSSQLRLATLMQRERAARHLRENENIVALTARRERSTELDDLVRPLLTSLAGGARLTPEIRADAAMTEAELRNGLRAKIFTGTAVARATREAFRRGVSVELMDDGGLNDVPKEIRHLVEDHVTGEIVRARSGSVTVRVPPAGRDQLVTVLRRDTDGSLERSEVDADGAVHHAGAAPSEVRL